jgi:hypothetical protein
MPTKPLRTVIFLAAALAATLAGCGGPEGFGKIDADAARQAMIARGKTDPSGRAKSRLAPRGPKRPAGTSVASRRR